MFFTFSSWYVLLEISICTQDGASCNYPDNSPSSWFLVLGSLFLTPSIWPLVLSSLFLTLSCGSQLLVPGSWLHVFLCSCFFALGAQFSALSSWSLVFGPQFLAHSPLILALVLGSYFLATLSWSIFLCLQIFSRKVLSNFLTSSSSPQVSATSWSIVLTSLALEIGSMFFAFCSWHTLLATLFFALSSLGNSVMLWVIAL